jgi:hypothetical protein
MAFFDPVSIDLVHRAQQLDQAIEGVEIDNAISGGISIDCGERDVAHPAHVNLTVGMQRPPRRPDDIEVVEQVWSAL